MTPEAQRLLSEITRRGRVTQFWVTVQCPPQYRKMRRGALDELWQGCHIEHDNDGWIVPAAKPSLR